MNWQHVIAAEEAGGFYDEGTDELVFPEGPTPEQEAAWRAEIDRLRIRTDEPEPTHEPGDPVHISTALGRVLARLARREGA